MGSIKGLNSIKFGIYKRGDKKKKPKNAVSDDFHSWLSYFGENKNEAFESIKSDLIKIIESAQRLDLEKIDDIHCKPSAYRVLQKSKIVQDLANKIQRFSDFN